MRVPRPVNEPGKGSYWMVDYSAAENEGSGGNGGGKANKNRSSSFDHQLPYNVANRYYKDPSTSIHVNNTTSSAASFNAAVAARSSSTDMNQSTLMLYRNYGQQQPMSGYHAHHHQQHSHSPHHHHQQQPYYYRSNSYQRSYSYPEIPKYQQMPFDLMYQQQQQELSSTTVATATTTHHQHPIYNHSATAQHQAFGLQGQQQQQQQQSSSPLNHMPSNDMEYNATSSSTPSLVTSPHLSTPERDHFGSPQADTYDASNTSNSSASSVVGITEQQHRDAAGAAATAVLPHHTSFARCT